MHKTTILSLPR